MRLYIILVSLLILSQNAFPMGDPRALKQKKMQGSVSQQEGALQGSSGGGIGAQKMRYIDINKMGHSRPESIADSVSGNDEMNVSQAMKQLVESSYAWNNIKDEYIKERVVESYIKEFRNRNLAINKPPKQYVKMINEFLSNNPKLLTEPFVRILQAVAIMEYDFDNGENKDVLARNLLGENGYKENKKRLEMKKSRK